MGQPSADAAPVREPAQAGFVEGLGQAGYVPHMLTCAFPARAEITM